MMLVTRTPRRCSPCAMDARPPCPRHRRCTMRGRKKSIRWDDPAGRRYRGWMAGLQRDEFVGLADRLNDEGYKSTARSASAMVSGMRSEFSARRTITNWPGLRIWAMRGAKTSNFVTFSLSCIARQNHVHFRKSWRSFADFARQRIAKIWPFFVMGRTRQDVARKSPLTPRLC